ncbi:7-cyano-7-deazaguanine synthase [Candidatus Roizmanbacteria bacterium CG02_land_8_20_14_3_00_36_15]|uniref:7-cyano-7-deazaguanine synthase n=4 Tax=Microgenomates group TaxID=1794810 RepID=A0A2G9Y6R7_9BACT|nr:MAG: 7-cyano-7-deazaguanine synthase [Candidatus Roizmanbacteria bacterium CG23_combo_of_CG06-09_8_20_14_all_35_49]PIV09962.1 MAG: 7-cyano-7-deazaguanine synthase [Candidatus Roizmanbacteria bacterium CG03_land_8_20_14_0_80_36_21]PIV38260.1 MAG: 7-cyano-7-deazaguanine synthase [Candidatus Roizmanbacteria bacterium CG02_land_8_20_14_3_00_36_15]PIY70039.1 MAG: 7-cyano-7-deazaguanine synthase [Candidatus Roizmanbacteria bacterium CG_4_10_14_0_8_um_filter_36_36]PJA53335.1 MAG: 7-cyano-7-deazagua
MAIKGELDMKAINRKIAVCTVSGGLDSAVAFAILADKDYKLHFIFFDWGQKTLEKERKCAKALAKHYNVDLKIVEIPFLKSLPDVSLTAKETLTTEINEYVPNRNAILESQAVAYAESLKAGIICVGSTGGDHICPDNSPKFIKAMQALINQGTMLKPPIQIIAPLMDTDKIGAVKLGIKLKVPFELTWSCHNNTDKACGKCSNCLARLEAFKVNNISDPTKYQK